MGKSFDEVEDFVLDPGFRKWVLDPDEESKVIWEEYLKENPKSRKNIVEAVIIVKNFSKHKYDVPETRIRQTWDDIQKGIEKLGPGDMESKVVPIRQDVSLKKYPDYKKKRKYIFAKTAAVVLVAIFLGVAYYSTRHSDHEMLTVVPLEFEEHFVPPGMKSSLTLRDGSKIILNSGSSVRYPKSFEPHQREIELNGEAFFEVAKDSLRPFIVRSGSMTTRVLGTSFNISAYQAEPLQVSLISGMVDVSLALSEPVSMQLSPGDAIRLLPDGMSYSKGKFERDDILAWTQKTIVFKRAKMDEVRRVLQNWYGVEILFANPPAQDLEISARFSDQSLKDVLEGLSYSARLEFQINRNIVTINFKD